MKQNPRFTRKVVKSLSRTFGICSQNSRIFRQIAMSKFVRKICQIQIATSTQNSHFKCIEFIRKIRQIAISKKKTIYRVGDKIRQIAVSQLRPIF